MADLGGVDVPGLGSLKRRIGTLEDDVAKLRSAVGRATIVAGGRQLLVKGLLQVTGLLQVGTTTQTVPAFRVYADEVTVSGVSTTSNSPNAFLDPADGRLLRSTSSWRYKQDVDNAAIDPAEVLALVPRTWRDRAEVETDPGTERRYTGLIAEELDAHPTLRQFVEYNADGDPDSIAYDRLAVALLVVVQAQAGRLDDLAARVDALEQLPRVTASQPAPVDATPSTTDTPGGLT